MTLLEAEVVHGTLLIINDGLDQNLKKVLESTLWF